MQDSHTPTPTNEAADHDWLRLVPTTTLGLAERLGGRLDGHLTRFAEHMREGLLAASVAVGLEVMAELMDAEVTDLAGPKGKHNPARTAKRHGRQDGSVTLGGRRVPVRRPRVRTVGDDEHELPLTSYDSLVSADLLADGVVARMLGGLSTRGYRAGLEPVGRGVEQTATGTSHSAVSRRFVAATAERLDQLLNRPLGGQRWLVVFLDGFGMGEHLLVGALGVTADGTKVPLGVVEGTTENKPVCLRLVTGLRDRGLDPEGGVLFVIDGGKALAAAVRGTFGAKARLQRCRRHRSRKESTWRCIGVGWCCGEEVGCGAVAGGCWDGRVAFLLEEGSGLADDVADGGPADVAEGLGEDVQGAQVSLVEDGEQDTLAVADLLREHPKAGTRLAWTATPLMVEAVRLGRLPHGESLGERV